MGVVIGNGENMKIKNYLSDKIKNIKIPVTEDDWCELLNTKRGKLVLLIIQCVISATTAMATLKILFK